MKLTYAVGIEQTPNNYGAYAPDVPGCISTAGDADQLPAVVQQQRHRYSGCDGRCSHPRLRRVNDGLGASRTSKTRPYTRACLTGPAWPTRDGSAFLPLGSGLSRPGARSGRP